MRFPMPLKLHPTCSCLAAIVAALAVLWAMAANAAPAELQLLMFERDGCSYCRQWNEEIGPAYPRTAEGAAAPLRRIDIAQPLPVGITLTGRPPVFTPTFVLLREGAEVARIEGYAGDEFFWVLLARMLSEAGWTPGAAAPAAQADTDAAPAVPTRSLP